MKKDTKHTPPGRRKVHSQFVALDVKRGGPKGIGYADIDQMLKDGGKVPVTITGHIVSRWSEFDGVSFEFQVIPKEVLVGEVSA